MRKINHTSVCLFVASIFCSSIVFNARSSCPTVEDFEATMEHVVNLNIHVNDDICLPFKNAANKHNVDLRNDSEFQKITCVKSPLVPMKIRDLLSVEDRIAVDHINAFVTLTQQAYMMCVKNYMEEDKEEPEMETYTCRDEYDTCTRMIEGLIENKVLHKDLGMGTAFKGSATPDALLTYADEAFENIQERVQEIINNITKNGFPEPYTPVDGKVSVSNIYGTPNFYRNVIVHILGNLAQSIFDSLTTFTAGTREFGEKLAYEASNNNLTEYNFYGQPYSTLEPLSSAYGVATAAAIRGVLPAPALPTNIAQRICSVSLADINQHGSVLKALQARGENINPLLTHAQNYAFQGNEHERLQTFGQKAAALAKGLPLYLRKQFASDPTEFLLTAAIELGKFIGIPLGTALIENMIIDLLQTQLGLSPACANLAAHEIVTSVTLLPFGNVIGLVINNVFYSILRWSDVSACLWGAQLVDSLPLKEQHNQEL